MPSEQNGILDDYLRQDELAEQLKVHPRTIERWRLQGIGPPVTWKGREPIYNIDSTRAWLRSREQRMPRERRRDQQSTQRKHS